MNILYGVPGEGMGHATRSKVLIDHLLQKGHQVMVVSSGRAFAFLEKNFPGKVIEIKGFYFAYKNGEVSKTKTFFDNLKSARKNLLFNRAKKILLQKSFTPELVISDFESFAFFYAKTQRLPLFSIDNMQVMDRCKLEIPIPKTETNNYRIAKNIVKVKVPRCEHYFISSFFDAEPIKKNTSLVPAIIRTDIIKATPTNGQHILMYQTSSSLSTVQEVLRQLPEETFYVYGMGLYKSDENVIYKPFSEAGFINDLASAKAVIANGGFSLLSEAVYLKKPVYAFPIHKQFEQFMNAAYIEKLGYGRHFSGLEAGQLKAFIEDLPRFQNNLLAYSQKGNEELFIFLDEKLANVLRVPPKLLLLR